MNTIKYIPRQDKQGRIEIWFPEAPHSVVKPTLECFGPLMQEGDIDNPGRYCWDGGPWSATLDRTTPVDDTEKVEDEIDRLLDEIRSDYQRAGVDVEFKRYERRTEDMRRNLMQEFQSFR